MLNAYFDIDPSLYGAGNWPIIPFVGVGVGGALVEFDDGTGSDDDELAFAYQFIGGFSFLASDNVILSVSYTYLDTDEMDFDGFEFDYQSHSVLGGIRFVF